MSTAVDAPEDAGTPRRRWTHARDAVAGHVLPGGGPRTRWYEAVLVLVITAPLAFFRLGSAAIHARVWAEDGTIFLQQAAEHGPIRASTIAYAGYLHGVPRLAAAVVYPLPVRLWGAGLHVVDAALFAWVALMVYVGLSDHLHSRVGRAAAALYLVLVPVGPEITGSIANVQWFLTVGAVVALLRTPRTVWGWTAIAVTTLGAVTSSPLGLVVFVAAVAKAVLRPGRGSLAVLGVTTVGYAAQVVEMLRAQQRPVGSLLHQYGVSGLVRGYLSRVAGDGVLGMDRLLPTATGTSTVAGTVVLLGLAAVVVLGAARRWAGPWVVVALLLATSVGTFLVAALLQPAPLPLANALVDGRYYSTPALFLVLGLIVLGAGLLERRAVGVRSASVTERSSVGLLGAAVTLLAAALAFGTITTYDEAQLRGRNVAPTWGARVRTANAQCRTAPPGAQAVLQILPGNAVWRVRLPCSLLRDH